MSRHDDLATITRAWRTVTISDFAAFDRVFVSGVIDRDPSPDQGAGSRGFKAFFTMLRSAFPDLRVSVERLVQNKTDVAMADAFHGTCKGAFAGIAPTGKAINACGVQVARFENGRIVRRWGSSDELGILKQRGARIARE